MPPSGSAYNVDWVFSNNSNVHVANHRDWFTAFAPFDSHLGHVYMDTPGQKVLGIGDVELEVQKVIGPEATRTRGSKTTIITLRNVLFVPSNTCNIFGHPLFKDYGLTTTSDGGTITDAVTGQTLGLLDFVTLWKILLKGQAKGQSSLDPKGAYMINASWSDTERARWNAAKSANADMAASGSAPTRNKEDSTTTVTVLQLLAEMSTTPLSDTEIDEMKVTVSTSDFERLQGTTGGGQAQVGAQTHNKSAPYNAEEKRWLKNHYGGEFKFLKVHGLKMHAEEDREEGRSIARAIMTEETEEP